VKQFRIKDLMVPLTEYAIISEEASIWDAVLALERAQEEFDASRYRHRAILVRNKEGMVIGKLGQAIAAGHPRSRYRRRTAPDRCLRGRFSHNEKMQPITG
jgi:hypothetical protein